MSFPRYPSYKDSGVEWLGEVPKHWDILPCRAIVHERTAKNDGGKCEDYLSLMANIGIIPYAEKGDIGNKKPEDLSKCKIVSRGDFVINSMNYGIGSYGLSDYDGVCSPVYIVLKPQNEIVEPRFAFRIFENRAFQTYAQSFGNGILEHRCAINWDILKGISVTVPSMSEQKAILTFLDRETAKIDELISEQQQLIEFLKEKRQSIISHAITKGINPDAPMKDSNIEWLGKVPKHWEVKSFRHVIKKIEQGWSPNAASEPCEHGSWGVLKLSAIKQGVFFPCENKMLLADTDPNHLFEIKAGDLLITRANTPKFVGDACVVTDLNGYRLMLSDLIYRIHLNPSNDTNYICQFLISSYGRYQIEADARGSSMTMAKISQGHINAWTFPVPPFLEQQTISAFLDHETAKLDTLTTEAKTAIALLQERRAALISAAVTGKIDVRGLVSEKPEVEQAA